jgi:hypothetical protein
LTHTAVRRRFDGEGGITVTTHGSAIVLTIALLGLGEPAHAEPPSATDAKVPEVVLSESPETRANVPPPMAMQTLRDVETGTVVLEYEHGIVLGPFLAIEGTAYSVPCGNPTVVLAPPSAQGFYAEEGGELMAYIRPRAGEPSCELFVARSRLVTRPFDWSRVRPDGTYDHGTSDDESAWDDAEDDDLLDLDTVAAAPPDALHPDRHGIPAR